MNARRLAAVVLLVASCVSLAVLCWRGVYVRYKADDFWTASIVARLGFWKSQSFWYQRWSGRFAYTFLIGIVEWLGPRVVPALVAPTIIAWFVATYLAFGRRAALAAAFVYAVAEGAMDVPQSILWQTGLLTYVVPIAGLTAWLATTIDRRSVRWYDAVVPFLLAGFSETNTLSQIIAVAAATIAFSQRRRIFATALVASIIALGIIAFSPGNAVRMSVYGHHSALRVIEDTLAGTGSFFMLEVTRSGVALLLVFVAAMLFAPEIGGRAAATAVAVSVCSASATYFASLLALGVAPPVRALIVPHFFFVISIVSLGAALPRVEVLQRVAAPLLIVLSVGGPVVSAVMRARDIPDAAAFARAWDRLDAQLRQYRGREVIVANASGSAGTLSFITHDRNAWSNRCITDYYSLAGIAADPPGRSAAPQLLENLPVYAVEGPRRHDEHNVVLLRFATD